MTIGAWVSKIGAICLPAVALVLLMSSYHAVTSARDAARYPAPGKLVDVGGYRLHIDCAGRGTPTVLFESGMSGWSVDWSLIQPRTAEITRGCAYDRAGYGWSEAGPGPRTSRQVSRELELLLQRAGIDGPIILVGHSLGGLYAQYYAATHPRQIVGLVLIDSVHPEQSRRMIAVARERYEGDLKRVTSIAAALAPTGLLRFIDQPASIIVDKLPVNDRPLALAFSLQSKAYRALADEMSGFEDSENEVWQVGAMPDVPVVVISSGRVRDFPMGFESAGMMSLWQTLQNDLAARSPGAEHIIARRSGHYIHLDQPDVIVDAISRLVRLTNQHLANAR